MCSVTPRPWCFNCCPIELHVANPWALCVIGLSHVFIATACRALLRLALFVFSWCAVVKCRHKSAPLHFAMPTAHFHRISKNGTWPRSDECLEQRKRARKRRMGNELLNGLKRWATCLTLAPACRETERLNSPWWQKRCIGRKGLE